MSYPFPHPRPPRRSHTALVEGKNGAVIRNPLGFGHLAGKPAEALQRFYTPHLNPYLNFHRPCGFATVSLDARGKRIRKYKLQDYATPYQKLKSLPQQVHGLKPNLSWARVDQLAAKLSHTECARRVGVGQAKFLSL